jgi:hypothetical protein
MVSSYITLKKIYEIKGKTKNQTNQTKTPPLLLFGHKWIQICLPKLGKSTYLILYLKNKIIIVTSTDFYTCYMVYSSQDFQKSF